MNQRTRRVLNGGPSDHRPFVCDLRLVLLGVWVRVVTYNAAKHNGERLEGIFGQIHRLDTEVWCLQEIKRKWGRRKDPVRRLRKLGYKVVYARPEFAVAWDPVKWEHVRHWRALMSPTEYWTVNYALIVVLRHRTTGELVKFVSAHPPAHVQAPRHPSWSKVWRVLHEWVDKARKVVRRNRARVAAVVFGLDLNVDVDKGWSPPGGWDWLEEGPLELIEPPDPTRGGRGIDVLMVRDAQAAA